MRHPFVCIPLAAAGLALASVPLLAANFAALGPAVPDSYDSVFGLADNGTVVGNSQDFESSTPVLWTKSGAEYAPARPVVLPSGAIGGELRWISADASLLAGFASRPLTVDGDLDQVPVVWSRSGSGGYVATVLPRLGGVASETVITGGSSNGARFIGQSGGGPVATVWRGAAGSGYVAQALALPAGANGPGTATSISSDGSRVVGRYETAAGTRAAVWTENGGTYSVARLQSLPGGAQSFAEVVSRNGALAGGAADDANGLRPVVWNTATGAATALETLPGFEATVLAIADNNLWFGGRATDTATFESTAVLWNGAGKIFDLVSLASSSGVSCAGLTLESVTGIALVSTGVYTIAGTGIRDDGATQGFVLENLALDTSPIPEPDTAAVAAGSAALAGVFLKRRQRAMEPQPGYARREANEQTTQTRGAGGSSSRLRSR